MSDAILSTKRAVLSSGGYVYNDLYYGQSNTSVSLLECTFGYNQIITLPSFQFGSTSQVNLPNDQFADAMILHAVLPNVIANQTICRSWCASMISSISFTLGSSNTTQIMLQGDSIYQTLMSQCSDPMKRLEIAELAGQEQLYPPITPFGEDPPINEAWILVPLPFSTLCDKLPLDETMLQNNISVQFQFNSNSGLIYGGTGIRPNSFIKLEIILRQGKLSNSSLSIRREMTLNSALVYNYPWIYPQNFVTQPFLGALASSNSLVSTQFNTFLNADLIGIMCYVVRDLDKNPINNDSPNPYNMDNISNITLSFGGQQLFRYPGYTYRMTNMLTGGEQSASYIPSSIISPGPLSPYQSIPKNCYPVFFDFSRLRSTCFQSHYFNTWRLTNQTLQMSFNTQFNNTFSYRCYATFFYNSSIEFSNGTSAIFID